MQHLAAASYVRTRWKNGAGETAQLAAFPAHAGLDDFLWRISIATIAVDSAFSAFPGIDRSILALDGEGCHLHVGDRTHLLRPGDLPIRFAGEVVAHASLIAGPVSDFNVMTRRGVADHTIEVLEPGTLRGDTTVTLVFALSHARLHGKPAAIAMGKWDLLRLDRNEDATLVSGAALAVRIAIDPVYNSGE